MAHTINSIQPNSWYFKSCPSWFSMVLFIFFFCLVDRQLRFE
jgi:hypothetical protein